MHIITQVGGRVVNLVYLVSSLKKTGLTSVLVNTAIGIDKELYNVTVISLSPFVDEDFRRLLSDCGVKIITLNTSKYDVIFRPKSILKNILILKPDILHSHCLRSFIFSSLYIDKTKKIMTLHSIVPTNYRYEFGIFLGFILNKLVDFCIYRHDLAIGVSESVRDYYNLHKKKKISCVLNGIDLTGFEFCSISRIEIRSRLGIHHNDRLHIYTGSLSVRKRIIELVKLYNQLEIKLLVVGDGPLINDVKLMAKDNIFVIGRVDNICTYLSASDTYVSFSRSEGMPNAVLEALSVGLPCILSDIPPHIEIEKRFPNHVRTICVNDMFKNSERIFELDKFQDFELYENNDIKKLYSNLRMANDYSRIYQDILK